MITIANSLVVGLRLGLVTTFRRKRVKYSLKQIVKTNTKDLVQTLASIRS